MKRKREKRTDQPAKKKTAIATVSDPVHPVQFWTNTKSQRWDPLSPEKRLWAAVLEDAFKCCVRGNVSGEGSRMRKQEEVKNARAWFLSEDADAGTFLWVCEKLDLDPKKILDKITGLHEKTRKAA